MDFVSDKETTDLCTFAIGKNNLIPQAIYTCETCAGATNVCCCAGCASVCHEGHDVNFVAFGESYCDCGHSGCNLVQLSTVAATKILQLNNTSNLLFDKDGRIGGSNSVNNFEVPRFNVEEILGLNGIAKDLLHKQCVELVSNSKETFWLGKNDTPRCSLEALAHTVFQHHTSEVDWRNLNSSNSGAEWWVQVKYSEPTVSNSDISTNIDGTTLSGGGVDLHYDKDEEVAAQFGLGIFPHISTVTYLTQQETGSGAAPTIVYEVTSAVPVGDAIKRCFVSIPEVGKHVAFDGRFLHGAPAQLRPFARDNHATPLSAAEDNETRGLAEKSTHSNDEREVRITFLVNVWLNYHPAAVNALSADIVSRLNSSLSNTVESAEILSAVAFRDRDSAGGAERFPVTVVDISERLTGDDCAPAAEELGSWMRIPFVSENTEWGKSEDESGLVVSMWTPSDVRALLRYNQQCGAASGNNKKKKVKLSHHTGKVDSIGAAAVSSGASSAAEQMVLSSTFQWHYRDAASVARLEYEEDSEAEDDFAGEFSTL